MLTDSWRTCAYSIFVQGNDVRGYAGMCSAFMRLRKRCSRILSVLVRLSSETSLVKGVYSMTEKELQTKHCSPNFSHCQ